MRTGGVLTGFLMQDLDETFTETSDGCLSETAMTYRLQEETTWRTGAVLIGFLILVLVEKSIEAS